jgi:hypothetical protein
MDSEHVDSGPSGFLDLFGSDAASEEAAPDVQTDAEPTAEAAADTSPPDDSTEWSAEERVAANLAASLEADGIAVPEPGEEAVADDEAESLRLDADTNLDDLTPEQMRQLTEQAIAVLEKSRETDHTVVAEKVLAAEGQAVAEMQQHFRVNVVAESERHYNAEIDARLEKMEEAADRSDNPAEYKRLHRTAIINHVLKAKAEHEAKQWAEYYEPYVKPVKNEARWQVPELRRAYAEHLAEKYGLPRKAADDILQTSDAQDFERRAAELVQIRDALAKQQSRHDQSVREEANKRLAASTVRPPATGRSRGRTPVPYTGSPEEGASIISRMHR